jgi:hypothetical protein
MLQRSSIVARVRQGVAIGVAEHMGVGALMSSRAEAAAPSIMREKPGAASGAPRSETNTNGEPLLSRRCLGNARSLRPVSGWVLGVPCLARRTWQICGF